MYAIYGNIDPIQIPQMLAYIPAPWIRHGLYPQTKSIFHGYVSHNQRVLSIISPNKILYKFL